MKWFGVIILGCVALAPRLEAVQESTATTLTDPQDVDETTSVQESEAKGIIPENAETLVSTRPITPISVFSEKTPYEQSKDELIRAYELMNAGHYEAASDTALEAYDDLLEIRRVPGVKRSAIRAQMRRAAGVYVEAGILYIKGSIKQAGGTQESIDEGKARLEDLRDVAKNYPDLNKKLQKAISQLPSLLTVTTK